MTALVGLRWEDRRAWGPRSPHAAGVEGRAARGDPPRCPRGDVGPLQVQEPRDSRSREREPEGRTEEAVRNEPGGAVELLAYELDGVLPFAVEDRALEVVAEQHGADREPADDDGRNRERDQRPRDDPRRLVQVLLRVVVHALLAVEHDEQEAEAIERGDEYSDEHSPVRERVPGRRRLVHGLDQRVLREEAREAREADQRQRADDARPVGDRQVFA